MVLPFVEVVGVADAAEGVLESAGLPHPSENNVATKAAAARERWNMIGMLAQETLQQNRKAHAHVEVTGKRQNWPHPSISESLSCAEQRCAVCFYVACVFPVSCLQPI